VDITGETTLTLGTGFKDGALTSDVPQAEQKVASSLLALPQVEHFLTNFFFFLPNFF
jgi:hypothetical protein